MARRFALCVTSIAALGTVLAACSADQGESTGETGEQAYGIAPNGGAHIMKLHKGPQTASAPAGAKLVYNGGPVLSNVKVYTVYWGASVPDQASLNKFYGDITSSAYYDWLTEYNTPTQTIGHGSFGGSVVDTTPPAGSTVTDLQIQQDITKLINAGKLPPNDANNLYMVHFPAGVTITMGGSSSCVQFCAYHGTYTLNGKNAYYGVMPDLSGGCAGGCGTAATKLQNQTSVASHELVEATTDAAVGLATVIGPPLAWYDPTNGEIGDICNGQQGVVAGWTVQKQFSNKANDCILTGTAPPPPPPPPPPNTCSHPLCSTGSKLVSSCDPCATKICAADSYCCSTAWDSICVGEVKSICGKTCP